MGAASLPQAIGPRAKISAAIWSAPRTKPYCEMVAFGYFFNPVHVPPFSGKVEHVLAMFSGVHCQFPLGQIPSWDSEEQAR